MLTTTWSSRARARARSTHTVTAMVAALRPAVKTEWEPRPAPKLHTFLGMRHAVRTHIRPAARGQKTGVAAKQVGNPSCAGQGTAGRGWMLMHLLHVANEPALWIDGCLRLKFTLCPPAGSAGRGAESEAPCACGLRGGPAARRTQAGVDHEHALDALW